MTGKEPAPLTPAEEQEVDERSPPRAKLVYTAVAKQGEDELDRPGGSLFWSAAAAGMAIIFSVVAEASLLHKLPMAPWREAVADVGYSLGFLIVILGRMQLFTEHTVVAVLPLAREKTLRNLRRVGRLWIVVLVGNLVGAGVAAALAVYGHLQADALLSSMIEVSTKLLDKAPRDVLLQGIPAGFLIASVAWIRSAADDSSFWIILVLTYAIGLGDFTHVIAGACEAYLLLFSGHTDLQWTLFGFILPALVGNIIGGTGLFALLAHAQVRQEI